MPHFDAAVWVSDKDGPGSTRLSRVLDLIAITLNYPEITRYKPDFKQREVDQLLRTRRVLLVIDNLETITDPALIAWLPTLPEPSKALATTRAYPPEFQDRGPWRIDLTRMSEREGRQFIGLHCRKINLAPAPSELAQQELITATGGNPKAIEIVLGLARRTGRPIAQILSGEIGVAAMDIETLIAASWKALNSTERQIILALSLFPTSAEDSALAQVAGISLETFVEAIQKLSDLALVET
jgi:hypothetical protein